MVMTRLTTLMAAMAASPYRPEALFRQMVEMAIRLWAAQTGEAAPENFLENVAGELDLAGVEPQIAAPCAAEQQQGEGEQLPDNGGQRRTLDAHAEGEDSSGQALR